MMSELTDKEVNMLAEAIADVTYVAGALTNTREDRLQDDLLQAKAKIKGVMDDSDE